MVSNSLTKRGFVVGNPALGDWRRKRNTSGRDTRGLLSPPQPGVYPGCAFQSYAFRAGPICVEGEVERGDCELQYPRLTLSLTLPQGGRELNRMR
jgi:hypothetical protein